MTLPGERPESYVADTHALYWYLQSPERLGTGATAAFRLAELHGAVVWVPAIVVAELFYLTSKLGRPLAPARLLADLEEAAGLALSDLGASQLSRLDAVDLPEMHDRLIAAEALYRQATIISKDAALASVMGIATVW